MTKHTRLAVLALAMSLVLALPGSAMALTADGEEEHTEERTEASVEERRPEESREEIIRELKARALEAIARRLQTIDRLVSVIQANEHITEAHARALLVDLADATRGLQALAGEIEAATTLEELRELIPKIFEDYLIYELVVPKVHLVIGADTLVDIAHRFEAVAEQLQDAINRAEEAGLDVTEAQAALDEMIEHINAAKALAGPVPGKVLPLQPEDWPGVQEVLRSAHSALQGAREQLRAAAAAAHAVVEALRNAAG
ncbi:MAG: hypothetical protein ACE5KX_02690 [Acidimicrobiia bacterium]